MLTRDQLAAWLGQVHADNELPAHTFKVAFGLTQLADPNGFIRGTAVAKLGRDAGEPIAETLGRLVANKHLYPVGDGSRSEEHTSELQSQFHIVCRLMIKKKNAS